MPETATATPDSSTPDSSTPDSSTHDRAFDYDVIVVGSGPTGVSRTRVRPRASPTGD